MLRTVSTTQSILWTLKFDSHFLSDVDDVSFRNLDCAQNGRENNQFSYDVIPQTSYLTHLLNRPLIENKMKHCGFSLSFESVLDESKLRTHLSEIQGLRLWYRFQMHSAVRAMVSRRLVVTQYTRNRETLRVQPGSLYPTSVWPSATRTVRNE